MMRSVAPSCPLVIFWQVTADLPFSTGVPAGHGHTYTSEYVDGWNAVLRPAGVAAGQLANLRAIIAGDDLPSAGQRREPGAGINRLQGCVRITADTTIRSA